MLNLDGIKMKMGEQLMQLMLSFDSIITMKTFFLLNNV